MELIELISIRIDEVRSQHGQDITELARRAGIKDKTLWKTLHGNREMKADELIALCYVLKLVDAASAELVGIPALVDLAERVCDVAHVGE